MTKRQRAQQLLAWLRRTYRRKPDSFVSGKTPLQYLIAIILSAQCTDKQVNKITPALFKKYKTTRAFADAPIVELERAVFSTGFYKSKARRLKALGRMLADEYGGKVPDILEELLRLPGVGRKTAYLVLKKVFGKNVGIAVDTHVFRLARALGLSNAKTPNTMSEELMTLFDPRDYLDVNEFLILHGRANPKLGREERIMN